MLLRWCQTKLLRGERNQETIKKMKQLLTIIAVAMFFFACKKDKQGNEFCIDTNISWQGDPAADGLGWTLLKDSVGGLSFYIPRNLADSFKVNGLAVHVCIYKTSEKFYCECAVPLNKYHITSIRKR